MLSRVVKRDDTVQDFNYLKIKEAILKTRKVSEEEASEVTNTVVDSFMNVHVAEVEEIQDRVEQALIAAGLADAAKEYILYRAERNRVRQLRRRPDPQAIADYIHLSKYSRYDPELGRRETWGENVDRRMQMDINKFPGLEKDIRAAFKLVKEKRVLPSMRSMQFGGEAIEQNNARLFNCSFSLVDRPEFFSEMFFLLLAGCGVGYSVQFRHVEKLPKLTSISRKNIYWYVAEDSIEGWADCIKELVHSYMNPDHESYGRYVDFDYSKIRPQGVRLKTSGGLAPGHVPLKQLVELVRSIFDKAQSRKLKPIECHDINCHIADGVLAGGIRRSSLIALFSPDDNEMMNAKRDPNWFILNPQRRLANNSAVLVRGNHEINRHAFEKIFEAVQQYGEPGFFFTAHPDYGCNPCGEIGLNPVDFETFRTGFSFCNLTEINAAACETVDEFYEAVRAAALIGTLQASYTNFPYLDPISKKIADREALLGVSITGIQDNPLITPEVMKVAAEIARMTNEKYAKKIGINPAARITTVKPSGTASLALGCVGDGIHAHHARRYIRRITANETEPVFNYFYEVNPHMCVRSVYKPTDWVVEFPVQAPDNAIVKSDFTAIEFVDKVFATYENWVLPGTRDMMSSPGLTHNVSCTVDVAEDEWDELREYVWNNRSRIAAMSFLPKTGDKKYPQAPKEAIVTAADEARWNEILESYTPVDYTQMNEEEDTTNPMGVSGCEGQLCEIDPSYFKKARE